MIYNFEEIFEWHWEEYHGWAPYSDFIENSSSNTWIKLLIDLGDETAVAIRAAQNRSTNKLKLLQQFHFWFDAFRNLKMIHNFRDTGLESLPLEVACKKAIFIDFKECPFQSLKQQDKNG